MSRHAFMHVVVRSDGQPTVLIMPRLGFYSTCGKATCAHQRCLRARERAFRRCENCGEQIKPGLPYIEHRNDVTGELVSQEHVQCPERTA